jgi:hypothetical protein
MTPSPSDAALSCALRQINTMGYKVKNNYMDVGFIAAEKKTSSLGKDIFGTLANIMVS